MILCIKPNTDVYRDSDFTTFVVNSRSTKQIQISLFQFHFFSSTLYCLKTLCKLKNRYSNVEKHHYHNYFCIPYFYVYRTEYFDSLRGWIGVRQDIFVGVESYENERGASFLIHYSELCTPIYETISETTSSDLPEMLLLPCQLCGRIQ